jgi:4-hydroxy-2-oxoheptanedioate aldolase
MSAGGPVALLAHRLAAGEKLFMAWCGIPDASVTEMCVREGYDAALLDMQHGAIDVASAIAGINACATAGKPALVRIPVGEFSMASRMLDAGAAAIVAPMINSVEDARKFAAFAKFPPMGERSWGPSRAITLTDMDAPTYLKQANSFQLAIAMIETRAALNALDDILSVPGIDGVLVGPSDLSIALSGGDLVDPDSPAVDEALNHILARCAHHKKIPTVFCMHGAKAKALSARGFKLCSIGTDQIFVRAGAAADLKAAKG